MTYARALALLALPAVLGALLLLGERMPLGVANPWSERPNLLLVVVDCLRPDHLGAYGYGRSTSPHIDRLARRGVRFERAYAPSPWTKPSVASLLSGAYPNVHGTVGPKDGLPAALPLLPEILADAGYRTLFVNGGNAFLEPRFGFRRGFALYRSAPSRKGRAVFEAFRRLLARGEDETPFFAYLHLMDLHIPYHENRFNERFANLEGAPPLLRPGRVEGVRERTARGEISDADKELLRGLYDGQVRYVDAQLGRLLEQLRAAGLDERTIVVLTADHGEEFWEHGSFEHGHSVYEELLRVPLVVAGAGIEPDVAQDAVSLVDLAPTILELVGVEETVLREHGRTLVPRLRGEGTPPPRPIFAMGTLYGPERAALVRGAYKAIRNVASRSSEKWPLVGARPDRPALELYDLGRDPRETRNLAQERPELSRALGEALDAFRRGADPLTPRRAGIDRELRQRLEALGYVEGAGPGSGERP